MNSVAVEVDNVHFALPVLLHIVGEHGVEDCGAGGEDVLVAPELSTFTGHHTVGKLALRKGELSLIIPFMFSPIQKCWRCQGRGGRQVLWRVQCFLSQAWQL